MRSSTRSAPSTIPKSVSRRIESMLAEFQGLVRNDIHAACALGGEILAIAGSAGHDAAAAAVHRGMGVCRTRAGEYACAGEHFARAIDHAERAGDRVLAAEIRCAEAHMYGARGESATALRLYEQALTVFERRRSRRNVALTLIGIGIVKNKLGDHAGALDSLLRSLALWRKAGSRFHEAMCYNNIAMVYRATGDHAASARHLMQAVEIYRETADELGRGLALKNLAGEMMTLERPDEAIAYAAEAVDVLRAVGAGVEQMDAVNALGQIHAERGELDDALRCYEEALAMASRNDNKVTLAYIYGNIGRLHGLRESHREMIPYLLKGLALADEFCDLILRVSFHRDLVIAYEAVGDLAAALVHSKRHGELNAEMLIAEKGKTVIEMQTRFNAEQLERDNEIQRLRLERLQQDLDHRNRELALQAMKLVQKNEFLAKLEKRIREREELDDRTRGAIVHEVRSTLDSDGEWEAFSRQLRQVSPEFNTRLARHCPSLTSAELKVCSLLKVGLSSKEIASVFSTSVRTVENQRTSIRKKINLPPRTSFHAFLASL